MINIRAFGATSPSNKLQPLHYQVAALDTMAVEIAVSHCGLCHSDLDFIENTWGNSRYPLIAGHEIVGHILQIGRDVTNLAVGERVGVGWQQGACFTCQYCKLGKEHFCPHFKGVAINCHGGFANKICVDSRFVYPIPDALPLALAAPLFCAGATVFNALKHCGIQPGMHIGIIGVGGLGHLAIQFAKAMACHVVAFELIADKIKDSQQLGANEVVIGEDKLAISRYHHHFDVVLSTADSQLALSAYLDTLKPQGKFCFAGMPGATITLPLLPLMIEERSICAVQTGSATMMQEMLQFALKHHIRPQIELLPMSKINTALMQLKRHRPRYRIVLYNEK